MALSAGPNVTGHTPEYSTYHYNSLSKTAAADDRIVQAIN